MKIVLVEPEGRSPLRTSRPQEKVQMSRREAREIIKEVHAMIGPSEREDNHPTISKLAKLLGMDLSEEFMG